VPCFDRVDWVGGCGWRTPVLAGVYWVSWRLVACRASGQVGAGPVYWKSRTVALMCELSLPGEEPLCVTVR